MSESRIANLGVLFTAMLAVMVTGTIPPLPKEAQKHSRRALRTRDPEAAVFGKRIKSFRTRTMKCTQTQLANAMGVTLSSVAKWETGQAKPSPMALMAIGRLDTENSAWWFERAKQKPAQRVEQPVGEAAEGLS